MDIYKQIRAFIEDRFVFYEGTVSFGDDTSFLESGIIDSTGILELVSFIEEHFNIKIEDEELIPDNLDSINNIVMFMNKKLAVLSNQP